MAKGRRFGRERLLGAPSYTDVVGTDTQDFSEDEVWSTAHDGGDDGATIENGDFYRNGLDRVEQNPVHHWTGRDRRQIGGLSLAFENGFEVPVGRPTVLHQYRNVDRRQGSPAAASAPVNVPVWPSFLRFDSTESTLDQTGLNWNDDDDDNEWMPPHEYLARQHGRRDGTGMATSVFEGVGRTLKGRDMRRVRDAVWNQTGFFG